MVSGIIAVSALDARAIERSKPTILWNRLMTRSAKAGRSQNVSVLTRRSRLIPAVLSSVNSGPVWRCERNGRSSGRRGDTGGHDSSSPHGARPMSVLPSSLAVMSRWLGNRQVLVEQADRYRDLAGRGDLRELSRAVMRAACANGSMTGVGVENMELLRALPDDDRLELAGIWARWYAHVDDDWTAEEFRRDLEYLRTELLMVASGVARGLDGDLLAAERHAELSRLRDEYFVWSTHRIWELADAELAAGRTPDAAVLAAFRRTGAAANTPGLGRTHVSANGSEPGLRKLLAGFPGPVLNSGSRGPTRHSRKRPPAANHGYGCWPMPPRRPPAPPRRSGDRPGAVCWTPSVPRKRGAPCCDGSSWPRWIGRSRFGDIRTSRSM